MRTMLAASLATTVAAIAMTTTSVGALHAQDGNDDARMRAPHERHHVERGRKLVPGVRIAEVGQGGTFIRLRDGTVWEVYLPSRTSTAEWRRDDYVTVKLAPIGQQGRYSYELFNGRAESSAVVEFRGKKVGGRDRR